MTSPNQHPPSTTAPVAKSSAQRFTTIASVGTIIVLGTGAFVLLVDWLAGWQLTRPWLQLSASFVGTILVVAAVRLATITRPRRIVLAAGGTLLLLAVLDSLDGQQNFLPLIVVLLIVWALNYADTTAQLLQLGRPTTRRRWVAVALGLLATLVYLGTAGYYGIVNLTVAPVTLVYHPLFGFGILIAMLLGWLGEIGPYGGPLNGAVRICPECGLRNIRERQTCKRCGAHLGPVEYVT